MENKSTIKKYDRKSAFVELKEFDHFAGEHDFMEVTTWKNGEGFDVDISGKLSTRFQLTWGEFDALKRIVKEINK